MAIERILGTDTGKAAFEKADRNFVGHDTQINDLEASKGYLNSNLITDFNTAIENGKFMSFNALNAPDAGSILLDVIREKNASTVSQIAHGVYGEAVGKLYHRTRLADESWTVWQKIATDKQPDWITATLLNGWTGTLQYRKNDLGIVSVRFSLTPGTVAINTVVSSLPVGYRVNSYSLPIDYKITNTGIQESGLYTNEYGGIAISNNSTVIAGQLVHGQFSFYTG